MDVDVVVIGGGAAGLMCAIEAGRRGRRVVVIEHSKTVGEKIRISGGGRCNFTNLDIQHDRYLSQNPHFAISALKRFSQWDFIALVDQANIAWHEKTLGQLFCDGSSKQIIAMLVGHADTAGVEIRTATAVENLDKRPDGYRIRTADQTYRAEALVIATGGKSIPKMGATRFGYQIAEQFGIGQVETRPALVPLTFGAQNLKDMAALSGTSVPSGVTCGGSRFEEGLLFTHRGLSGPSILQISSYWRAGEEVLVDFSQGRDIAGELAQTRQASGRISLKNALAQYLPEKMAALMVRTAGLGGNLADQSNAKLERLAQVVTRWSLKPTGTEGYRTAEVTLGGVDTRALNATTMEARDVPGLYFVGEVVDVTGWLGGYNFQWAWSSGWAAGQVV